MSELDFRRVKNPDTGEIISTENLIAGVAKAWVSFNNTAIVNDSFNVLSMTDEATGKFYYSLINAMLDTRYSTQCSSNVYGTTHTDNVTSMRSFPYTPSSVRCTSAQTNSNVYSDVAFGPGQSCILGRLA